MSLTTIGIGSTIWIFDQNRRVYSKEPLKKGQLWPSGPPIWREHWRPCQITGETSRSWLVGPGRTDVRKISKRDLAAGEVRGVLTSEAELDAACFVQEHAREIGERVRQLSAEKAAMKTADVLKQIARLIGYEPGNQS